MIARRTTTRTAFAIGVHHCGTHYTWDSAYRVPFRAHGTRREATVFPLLAGPYEITPVYDARTLAPIPLVVPVYQ